MASAFLFMGWAIENWAKHSQSPVLAFYSYCSKTTFEPEIAREMLFMKVETVWFTVSFFLEFVTHISIFIKQTEIESRATVFELRGGRLVSKQRHQRNIVSMIGHFVQCLLNIVLKIGLFTGFNFLSLDDKTSTMIRDLTAFFIPSYFFCIYPVIETFLSENLRGSLFMVSWRPRVFQ